MSKYSLELKSEVIRRYEACVGGVSLAVVCGMIGSLQSYELCLYQRSELKT